MNILELIKKETNGTALSSSELSTQKKLIERATRMQCMVGTRYTLERPELRHFGAKSVANPQTQNPSNDYLSAMQVYKNLTADIQLPYLKEDTIQWGYSTHDDGINTSDLKLVPHRISTYVDINLSIDTGNEDFSNKVAEQVQTAVYNKVISTMFSNVAATDEAPKGLFNGITPLSITEDNLLKAIENVASAKCNGTWVMSASVAIHLMKNFGKYFDGDKFMNFPFAIDGRVEKDYMAFIDLSKVALGDWTIQGITIDNFTKKYVGLIRVFVETFADFGLLDDDAMNVLKLS